jgi:DNA-binding response OmpR family regulator
MKFSSLLKRFSKILIVEDDVTLRTTLAAKFKDKGYGVLEASAASEVRSLLANENPSAIVLDLILPMKDGISLLEELRSSGFVQPVVIISNLAGSEDLRADATRLGAAFYNKSSASLDEIVAAVEEKL